MHSFAPILLSLLVALAAASSDRTSHTQHLGFLSARHTAHAACPRGPRTGPVCCAPDCPSCGGARCGAGGRASRCCAGRIRRSGRICGRDAPPCVIAGRKNRRKTKTFPAAPADPTCATGVAAGRVCCPAACGTCGGSRCGSDGPGGAQCCIGPIQRAAVSCDVSAPPCMRSRKPSSGDRPNRKQNEPATRGKGLVGVPGKWVNVDDQLTGRPQARHEACFLMVNGKGYLLGGRGDRGISILDPLARTWTKGPPMKRMMHHMQCVAVGSKIYIVAGWEGHMPCETNLERMHIFDTDSQSWSTGPALPRRRRRGSAGVVALDGRIYVVAGNIGGHGANAGRCPKGQPPARTIGWFDYFEIAKNKWIVEQLPDMEEPRDHVTAEAINGEICVAGGRDGAAKSFFAAVRRSTFCFSFRTKKWRRAADIPTPRAAVAPGLTCDGRMVLVGGEGKYSPAFDETEFFDGRKWSKGPILNRERHGTGLAVARCPCGHIFIASGSGKRGGSPELTSTELYVPPDGSPTCSEY